MTHKNTVKTRRARENSAILEETQSQCTVGRRSLLLWVAKNIAGRWQKKKTAWHCQTKMSPNRTLSGEIFCFLEKRLLNI